MSRRALIFGVGGQDGAYLSRLLLEKGYEVHGTSRGTAPLPNLKKLGVADQVTVHNADPCQGQKVEELLEHICPGEIYYLAAQSSVWRSFNSPAESLQVSAVGVVNVLETARRVAPKTRILNAASGDCFGETSAEAPANEGTPFAPRSPYAVAKCAGHYAVQVARLAYGQFVCSAFLFNHESGLRSEDFAVGRIAGAARRIAQGSDEILEMGDLAIVRDWGWAPEYVEAMRRMLQLETPQDLVVATGRSCRLEALVEGIFRQYGLDWQRHVRAGGGPKRPTDIRVHHADPRRARTSIDWVAETDIDALCARLVNGRR